MKFTVMNRQAAKKYSYHEHGHSYIIISINNIDESPNRFNHNDELVNVLSLFFDDVGQGQPCCMKQSDADKIIKFVNAYMNVDECVVHCSAGVSRSAGVAAALMKIVNDSDKEIFDDAKYSPNIGCYSLVLKSFFGSYDKEPLEEKYRCNIETHRLNTISENQ